MSLERRETPRVPLQGRPPMLAQVAMDGVLVPVGVAPHDLSSRGLRGKWESRLPEGGPFALHLTLGKVAKFTARVAWQRPLPRGAVLAGVTFVRTSKSASAAVQAYLDAVQAETRRADERVPDIVPVEVITADDDETFIAIATNLSRSGLQLANDGPLPEGAPLSLLLPLTWAPPLELRAEVRWQRSTVFGGWEAGLQFVDVPPDGREILEAYLGAGGPAEASPGR